MFFSKDSVRLRYVSQSQLFSFLYPSAYLPPPLFPFHPRISRLHYPLLLPRYSRKVSVVSPSSRLHPLSSLLSHLRTFYPPFFYPFLPHPIKLSFRYHNQVITTKLRSSAMHGSNRNPFWDSHFFNLKLHSHTFNYEAKT